MASTPDIEDALERFVTPTDGFKAESILTAGATLVRMLRNTEKGGKFLRLNLNNPKLVERVLCFPGATDIFRSVGFVDDPNEDGYLVMPEETARDEEGDVAVAASMLESLCGDLQTAVEEEAKAAKRAERDARLAEQRAKAAAAKAEKDRIRAQMAADRAERSNPLRETTASRATFALGRGASICRWSDIGVDVNKKSG